MRKGSSLLAVMVGVLILLRGTRVPGPIQTTVSVWVLSFFIVLATLAVLRFPGSRWARPLAVASTVVLVLIPPTPDAWLGDLPAFLVVLPVLWFLSLVVKGPDGSTGPESGSRRLDLHTILLFAALTFVSLLPEILLRLPHPVASWLEWRGAWGPLLMAGPLILAGGLLVATRALFTPRANDPDEGSASPDGGPAHG